MVKKYIILNSSECQQIEKSVIIHNSSFIKEIEDKFEVFFSDKANVSMSSYKVDSRTN